jgi:hypothetical protein
VFATLAAIAKMARRGRRKKSFFMLAKKLRNDKNLNRGI